MRRWWNAVDVGSAGLIEQELLCAPLSVSSGFKDNTDEKMIYSNNNFPSID